jgi:hypothetical protein
MAKIHLGIVIANDSFDTPFILEAPWSSEIPPQYNSEFRLKPEPDWEFLLRSVRVVGPSYDLVSGELRFVEVRFNPEYWKSSYYDAARALLEKEGFKEVNWNDWNTRTWPWLEGADVSTTDGQPTTK